MARRAPQNSFQQTNGFLRQPITGKEVDIGERLGDKFLRFVIELGICRISRGLSLDLRCFRVRRQLGSSLLHQFDWQRCFFFMLAMLCYRSLFFNVVAQFAKNCVQLALGGIAVRLLSDKFFVDFLRALILLSAGKSVAQVSEIPIVRSSV